MDEHLTAHEKAEGLANHLEHVQWKRRPGTCCPDRPPIFTSMRINCEDFENDELIVALKSLKKRKATGVDDIPAEFWQVCLDSEDLLQQLLKFINLVWQTCEMPKEWHVAQVACLLKKGNPALADNYRPISLLCVIYKLFSSMLLHRLKKAGVEDKIWETQFGFRSKRGTKAQ